MILATKLYVPPPQPRAVPRPRLIERLDESLHSRLILVSAPAGSGKTTLVGEWIAGGERPAAWLSLDEEDNDPNRFLAYLIAAVQTVADVGEGLLDMLRSPQPPPAESILTALLNEISTVPEGFVLVLDDYHVIDARPVDDVLTFLIEHLPPRMHLLICTREDPHFPLPRLRARGQLTELRVADLRFTSSEAAAFLNQVMGLDLSAEQISTVEARTEGWIAGLQLAALSMRGREDISGFIKSFAGDNRYILDYLVEEVLQRQPERVRSFLLDTSILNRLNGSLCDAVTGREEGNALLESLERGNLFVVPLDDRRHWFRYHHLFADVLSVHLRQERPDEVATLHRRASEWHERNGPPSEAIRHALAAGVFERAAALIELSAQAMLTSGQDETLLGWLSALPDELVRSRPVLGVYYALALVPGDLEAAEARLRDAERLLDTTTRASERAEAPPVEMVVADEEGFRSLPGIISIVRAYCAGTLGDVPGSVDHARRALDLLPADDLLWRGAASALLGIAHWNGGDLEAAYTAFADGMASLRMTGDITLSISGAFILADIRMAQGRLCEAARIYEKSLKLATEQGEPMLPLTADLYVGMSELRRERDDLEAASRYLLRSRELGEHAGIPDNRHRWYVATARIQEAQGDLDGALESLDEAERVYIRNPDPDVRPIAALKTRVWVRQGRLTEALGWAREWNLSSGDDPGYLSEFEHITLARALIAQYESDRSEESIHEATGFLERLLQAAEEGGRTGSVIEILMLQALVRRAQGDIPAALAPLSRALALAEPEDYVRTFLDEGGPVAELLARFEDKGETPRVETPRVKEYVHKLLSAFEAQEDVHPPSPAKQGIGLQALAEPLSHRELEVLRLVARGLSNREISEQLFLAVITVKGHNRNIFRKLRAGRRTEAVARARELGLL